MNNIENRIVEMKFDNEQFEQAVAKTMDTLDKFKDKLNFEGAGKGLDKAGKAVNDYQFTLNDIGTTLNNLSSKFSTLGTIGTRVIERMTDAALNFVGSKVGTVFDDIVGGGMSRAKNLEQAKFQMNGLLRDAKRVNEVIYDEILPELLGTPYSLDQAAVVIGQLIASGKRTTAEIHTATKAIAGVAAMTNSDFASIGNIFTKVAGNGRVMGDTLQQLASRGLNAAADLKNFFNAVNDGSMKASKTTTAAIKEITGGLQITEQQMRDFVSDEDILITYEMFAEAMSGLYGDQAQKSTTMYTGALEDLRAALARVGAELAAVKLEFLRDAFNALVPAVDAVNAVLKPFTSSTKEVIDIVDKSGKTVHEYGKTFSGSLAQKIQKAGWAFQSLFVQLDEGHDILRYNAKEMEGYVYSVRKDIAVTPALAQRLKMLGVDYDHVNGLLKEGTHLTQVQTKVLKDYGVQVALVGFRQAGNDILYYNRTLRAGQKVTDDQAKAIRDMGIALEVSNGKIVSCGKFTRDTARLFRDLGFDVEYVGSVTDDWVTSWGQAVSKGDAIMNPAMWRILTASTNSFVNIMRSLGNVLIPVARGFREVFGFITLESIADAAERFRDFTKGLILSEEQMEKLKTATKIVFTPLSIALKLAVRGVKALASGISAVWKRIKPFVNVIFSFVGTIGEALISNVDKIIDKISAFAGKIRDAFLLGLDKIIKFTHLDVAFGWLQEKLSGFTKQLSESGNAIGTFFNTISEKFHSFWLKIDSIFGISDAFAYLRDVIVDLRKTAIEKLHLDKLGDGLTKIKENFEALAPEGGFIDRLWGLLKAFSDWAAQFIDFKGIIDLFKKTAEGLFTFLGDVAIPIIGFFIKAIPGLYRWVAKFFKELKEGGVISELIGNLDPRYKFAGEIKRMKIGLESLWLVVKSFFGIDKFSQLLPALGGKLRDLWKYLTEMHSSLSQLGGSRVKLAMMNVFNKENPGLIKKFFLALSYIKDVAIEKLRAGFNWLIEFLSTMDSKKLKQLLGKGAILVGAIYYIRTYRKALQAFNALTSLVKIATGGLAAIGKFFSALRQIAKYIGVAAIIAGIGVAVLGIAAAIKIISTIPKDQLTTAATIILTTTIILGIIAAVLIKFVQLSDKFDPKMSTNILFLAAMFAGMGIAMLMVAESMKKLSEIYDKNNPGKLIEIGLALAIIMLSYAGVLAVLMKFGSVGKKFYAAGVATIGIAKAMDMLAGALTQMGMLYLMDPKAWEKGFQAVALFMLLFVAFAASTNSWVSGAPKAKIFSASLGMIAIAGAMLIMAEAVKMLGNIEDGPFKKGLIAIGVIGGLFVAIGLVEALIAKANTARSVAGAKNPMKIPIVVTILGIALALGIVAQAVTAIASMDEAGMTKVGLLLFGIAAALIIFMAFGPEVQAVGIGLMGLAAGVMALAAAVYIMSNVDTSKLFTGLMGLVIAMAALWAITKVISTKGIFKLDPKAALAILAVGAAIAFFAAALSLLALIPFDSMALGLGAIAVIIVAIAGTLILLEGAGPHLMFVGAAFALLGLAVLAIAAAFALLIATLSALIPVFYALSNIDKDKLKSGLEVLTIVAHYLADALMILAGGVIALGLGFIVGAVGAALFAIAIAAIGLAFTVAAFGLTIFTGALALFLWTLQEFFGGSILKKLGDGLMNIGSLILNGLGGLFKKVKNFFSPKAAQDTFEPFMDSGKQTVDKGFGNINSSIDSGNYGMESMFQESGEVAYDGGDLIGTNLYEGYMQHDGESADWMNGQMSDMFGSMNGNLPEFQGLTEQYGISLPGAGTQFTPDTYTAFLGQGNAAIDGVNDSRRSYNVTTTSFAQAFGKAAKDNKRFTGKSYEELLVYVISSMGSFYDDFANIGKNIADGLAQGMLKRKSEVAAASASLANFAEQAARGALGINSPSRVFRAIGEGIGEGFVMGMENMYGSVASAATTLSDKTVESMSDAIAFAANAVMMDSDFTPTITPVVDLSNVRASVGQVNGMFSNSGINLSANADMMALLRNPAFGNQNQQEIASTISTLADKLEAVTDTMNNRQMNNYFSIDGATDPEAFADGIVRRLKMNSRSV